MIVRQFLHWTRNAPAGMRAEATSALVRSYLYSDLSSDERAAAEGAMLMMLDDPSPLVRLALAEGLADSSYAPPAVLHALAGDQAEIARVVLEHSVLFIDADLVEFVATGSADTQAAIARRVNLPRAVAAAIAEVGSAESCLILIENPDADVAQFSIDRIAERHGALAAIRESLLARHDLPASTRQALISKLSGALADFVTARQWLGRDRAQRIVKEACEKAAVTIAADVPEQAGALVRHLRATSQLNAGLLLRALLSGNVVLFVEALAELSELPLARVQGIVQDRSAASFRALYEKAGLPASTYPAFREAVAAMREGHHARAGNGATLKRRMIERVLRGCEQAELVEVEPLLMLLRRFATEAAREEARLYCDDLIAHEAYEAQLLAEQQLLQVAAETERLTYDYDAYEQDGAAYDHDAGYGADLAAPGPNDDWPQVHFEPGEGPHYALDRADGELDYADQPRQDIAAYPAAAYGQDAAPAYWEPELAPRDPLIEFYYQHLGPLAEPDHLYAADNDRLAIDPLANYRPGSERMGHDYAHADVGSPYDPPAYAPPVDRYERAAA